jgi:4-azaleucine resistance transporter AzlC
MSKAKQYQLGLKAGIPVVLGFIPIAIAFAMMSEQSGVSMGQTIMMSVLVFAGASQMMAVGMLGQGAAMLPIVMATFILNLRHLIMSTCVMNRLKGTPSWFKLLLAFGVTDESFAIFTTMEKEKCSSFFFLGLICAAYSSWVVGTIIGSIASQFLPAVITNSLGIALYAMFIALLVPNVKKSLRLGLVVLVTAAINIMLSKFMDRSWSIIFSTLIGAAIGVFIAEDEDAAGMECD